MVPVGVIKGKTVTSSTFCQSSERKQIKVPKAHHSCDAASLQEWREKTHSGFTFTHFPSSRTMALLLSAPTVNTAVLSSSCLYNCAGDTFPSNEHRRWAYSGSFKSLVTKHHNNYKCTTTTETMLLTDIDWYFRQIVKFSKLWCFPLLADSITWKIK